MSRLSNHYSVTLNVYPNTYIYPGMLIFVSIEADTSDAGWPMDENSLSNQLGLGGYHIVTKVDGSVNADGSQTTTIEARWTRTTSVGAFKRKREEELILNDEKRDEKLAACKALVKQEAMAAQELEINNALDNLT